LSPGKFGDKGATVCGDAITIGNGGLYHGSKTLWAFSVNPAQCLKETKVFDRSLENDLVWRLFKDLIPLEKAAQGRLHRDMI
jgi:hypothetical protein